MRIDLGQKMDFPEGPIMVAAPKEESKVHYPSIYIRGGSELKAIPESGTITFRFKRVSKSERERDGQKNCELELECREITDVASGSGKSEESPGRALDALKEEVEEDY
jgi:hypothetical protein